MTISAKQFFDTWVNVYSEKTHQESLNSNWGNRKIYTKEIASVCSDIAKKLNLKCWDEPYYPPLLG